MSFQCGLRLINFWNIGFKSRLFSSTWPKWKFELYFKDIHADGSLVESLQIYGMVFD